MGVLAVTGATSPLLERSAQAAQPAPTARNLVLVHGLFADGSCDAGGGGGRRKPACQRGVILACVGCPRRDVDERSHLWVDAGFGDDDTALSDGTERCYGAGGEEMAPSSL